MDPQQQLPIKSKVPALARGEVLVFYFGVEKPHFYSEGVDLESFPARDIVPLSIVRHIFNLYFSSRASKVK